MTAVERLIAEAVEQGHRPQVDDITVLATVAAIITNATAHKAVTRDRQAA